MKDSRFHQVYVPHLINPFISWHSCLGNCRQRCYEHGSGHLFNRIILFPSSRYAEVGLPDGLVALFWFLLRSFRTVLQSSRTSLHSHRQCHEGFPFSTSPPTPITTCLFGAGRSDRWEVIPPGVFDVHASEFFSKSVPQLAFPCSSHS